MSEEPRPRFDWGVFKTVSFWASFLLSLLIAGFYLLSRPEMHLIWTPGVLEIIEAKMLDLRFQLRGKTDPGDDIVIVAVDEKTEDQLGRWQSSGRQWLAKLLAILIDGNARVVGFDLTLAEPNESVNLDLLEELQAYSRQQLPRAGQTSLEMLTYLDQAKAAHDYDAHLAESLRQSGNVVLGVYHFLDAASASHLTPELHELCCQIINRVAYTAIQFPPDSTPQPLHLRHSFGVEPNLPIFSDAAKSFGHFNVISDRDGYIRFMPLLIEYQGDYYPSLALEVARWYLNPALPPIIHALGQEGAGSVDAIELGGRLIPSDEEGKLMINYYGPRHSFLYYSLADVILGNVPSYKFADRIVLVGFTSNIYQDLHSTPFQDQIFPGVEIHATTIANILQNDFLTRPQWTTLVEAAIIIILGLLLGVVRHQKSPIWGIWAALLALLGIFAFALTAFLAANIWINVTFPLLFIGLDYLMITSYKYFTEERQKRGLKNAFQHYVSPTVVNEMLKTIDDLKLGGERRQLTALFCDIRGFTGISEQMPPEELVEFLNQYFSEMTQIVLSYEGTLDKYVGDAIMAFYGAPLEQPDHAGKACKTAVDMILRLKQLQVGWEARGLPSINIGIGINTGDMIVGNMGSWERFDYTVMGDHVNLASRLEGLNKHYGTTIVISQFTYDACQQQGDGDLTVRELDTVRVKGRDEPVIIYELFGYGSLYAKQQDLLAMFSAGIEAYKQRQWSEAIGCFQDVLKLDREDTPSKIYIDRCVQYSHHPPPPDWQGVFESRSK
ncbi:CHASE2 domain-containing protein [candidate division KSB3 bacterium]|uniref:CHASE2 domain-containing protein n=1 Tax=candidate division KSB3 bacterium TaxID=2044937 RepID=A0A9D5Q5L9_9BACT|nr:CHASE2 domain-containing protein [candidate division KSB3 bacterium]MBD3324478.1 CHASE2 domain-containing protein [candidate division KSB3 bacterium]